MKLSKIHFELLPNLYQISWETSAKGSDLNINCIYLLCYKCQEINPNYSGSYISSPDQIKNKKATVNPNDKNDNKCSQYTTLKLNHKQIRKDLGRITSIKPFIYIYIYIYTYNWKEISF